MTSLWKLPLRITHDKAGCLIIVDASDEYVYLNDLVAAVNTCQPPKEHVDTRVDEQTVMPPERATASENEKASSDSQRS